MSFVDRSLSYRYEVYTFAFILAASINAWGQPNELDLLLKQKKEIEDRVAAKKDKLIVLVRIKGEEKTQVVKNENWPENIETTFNVLKNEAGQVIYVAEFPTSESGDWTLELKHFFNDAGETFIFQKRLTYFNDDCGNGVVIDTQTDVFGKGFSYIGTLKQLVDGKGIPIADRTTCSDPYQWTVDKKSTALELMRLKKIQL